MPIVISGTSSDVVLVFMGSQHFIAILAQLPPSNLILLALRLFGCGRCLGRQVHRRILSTLVVVEPAEY